MPRCPGTGLMLPPIDDPRHPAYQEDLSSTQQSTYTTPKKITYTPPPKPKIKWDEGKSNPLSYLK